MTEPFVWPDYDYGQEDFGLEDMMLWQESREVAKKAIEAYLGCSIEEAKEGLERLKEAEALVIEEAKRRGWTDD